jgi:hypothetical protein
VLRRGGQDDGLDARKLKRMFDRAVVTADDAELHQTLRDGSSRSISWNQLFRIEVWVSAKRPLRELGPPLVFIPGVAVDDVSQFLEIFILVPSRATPLDLMIYLDRLPGFDTARACYRGQTRRAAAKR